MNSSVAILRAIPGNHSALLPVVPQREPFPSPSPMVLEVLEDLATLHLAAFVAVYGPPPPDVALAAVHTTDTGAGLKPGYLGRLEGLATPRALEWLGDLAAGLDRWDEAGFRQPLQIEPAAAGKVLVSARPFADAVLDACTALKQAGRANELRHLADHLGPRMPAGFDPDRP